MPDTFPSSADGSLTSNPLAADGLLLTRLAAEVERCVRYRRPLAVAVLLASSALSAARQRKVLGCLRKPDELFRLSPRELLLLLPETSDQAGIPVQRALGLFGDKARAGVAVCPADGSDPLSLLDAARQAANSADPGKIAAVKADSFTVEVAGRRMVAADPVTRKLLGLLRSLARSTIPVLLVGETGAGKEVAALALHDWSPRRAGPFVAVNCAAFAETLLESELFGHEKGAFSGADRSRIGLLEAASGGTLLLDEISEASPRVQAELLRVIETQAVRRLGGVDEVRIDVRLVAATNRPVQRDLATGRLRRDLYYRLGAAAVRVPPLRERPADIEPLWSLFFEDACRRLGRSVPILSSQAAARLSAFSFPGNVRELRQIAEYLAAVVEGSEVAARHLDGRLIGPLADPVDPGPDAQDTTDSRMTLAQEVRQLEIRRIRGALEACAGVRVRAAERLGMPLRTLVAKLSRYGLRDIPSTLARRKRQP